MYICHINNNKNPIVHSLTRSRVRRVSSMPLHPPGPNSFTLRRTQSIVHVYVNTKNNISIMPHNHNQMTNSIIIWITCKQVSLKNNFAQCAQEKDVTYTPSWSKIHPIVSEYISDEIMCITVS
jgi:hypothetical protein